MSVQCYHCNGLNMSHVTLLVWAWEVRPLLWWLSPSCPDLIIDANMPWLVPGGWWTWWTLSPLSHMSHVTSIKPHELPHIRLGDMVSWRETAEIFNSTRQWPGCRLSRYVAMITFHVTLPTHQPWIYQHNEKYGLHFLHQRSLCPVQTLGLGRVRGKTDEIPHKSRH